MHCPKEMRGERKEKKARQSASSFGGVGGHVGVYIDREDMSKRQQKPHGCCSESDFDHVATTMTS